MRIFKAILGGLVGGGLGIAVIVSISALAGYDATWLGLIIGFLAGFGVRYIAPGTGKSDYVCGALAALFTLAAIVISNYATATVLNLRTAHLATPVLLAEDQPSEEEANIGEVRQGNQVEKDHTEAGSRRVKSRLPMVPGRPANRFDASHLVWLSLAAVIAYLLGRGGAPLPKQSMSDSNIDE